MSMKIHSERPNLWHVFVTLFAMFYLKCISKALFVYIHSSGITNSIEVYLFILLFAWAYLIRDLIKQMILIAKWLARLLLSHSK